MTRLASRSNLLKDCSTCMRPIILYCKEAVFPELPVFINSALGVSFSATVHIKMAYYQLEGPVLGFY